MGYMQCMAHRGGHTVIASIHQPRAAIWAMFDTVRRAAGGRVLGACDRGAAAGGGRRAAGLWQCRAAASALARRCPMHPSTAVRQPWARVLRPLTSLLLPCRHLQPGTGAVRRAAHVLWAARGHGALVCVTGLRLRRAHARRAQRLVRCDARLRPGVAGRKASPCRAPTVSVVPALEWQPAVKC